MEISYSLHQKQNTAVINKAKYVLGYNVLHILFIYSMLLYQGYCLELWGNTYLWNFKIWIKQIISHVPGKTSSITSKSAEVFLFFCSEDQYNGRKVHFKHWFAKTTLKQSCISVYGLKLWNSLKKEMKMSVNVFFSLRICMETEYSKCMR